MASRILLISANRCAHPDPVFPLGLAYLNAALRQAGHQCLWLDSLADAAHFGETLRNCRPDYVGLSLRNIDDVLIRKQETYYEDVPSLVALIRRELRCPVILGGSGFSIFPERLLDLAGADFGIAGEGETSFPALIDALETGKDFHSIPGVVYRRNGNISRTPTSAQPFTGLLGDADRPPSNAAHYLQTGSMLNVQTQRGCAFRCSYCTYPIIEGRQHRGRPPDLIADEFEQLNRQGARYAFIVDSVFNSSVQHVTETCEALVRRRNKLPWGCFLRPQGLTPELMKLLARAGLAHIEFGSDSFCDDVLAAYRKGFTFEEILASSNLAREARIDFCHFLISGGPGETIETLERGFENSRRLDGAVIMAVVGMRIYPGTALFDQALAEGRISRATDLLKPAYYLAPGLTAGEVFARLQAFAHQSPNWIVGDPDPAYQNLVARLRKRGVAGPLWSYFSMIQRLWPQGLPGGNTKPV
ncbi:MAG TPA: lipid biosynthesis B12-binding/radical SAM protein [Verrucomicrobiae bacterium]